MRRLNIGAERYVPGWENADVNGASGMWEWDVRQSPPPELGTFDYAVCSFMIQELTFHELPGGLENIRAVLNPGGRLRVQVPNIIRAFSAWTERDRGWFPQDERSGGVDGAFCSYVTWFGTTKSVFTADYLLEVCYAGGFEYAEVCLYGVTNSRFAGITELDSRPKEALIVEAVK